MMAKEAFSRSISLSAGPELAWRTITDVPTLVGWVSLLVDAETITEMERYRAVLADRIGMFALKADLDIAVTESQPPTSITIRAQGEDRQVGSRIVVIGRAELQEGSGGGTHLAITGTYEVSGRVATLGAGMIRKKAGTVLDEFFGSLERELG